MSMIQQIESWAQTMQKNYGHRPTRIDMGRAYFNKLKAELELEYPMVQKFGLPCDEINGMKIIIHD